MRNQVDFLLLLLLLLLCSLERERERVAKEQEVRVRGGWRQQSFLGEKIEGGRKRQGQS